MRILVVAVGKVREPHIRKAIDDYVGRLGHYLKCEEVEVPNDAALLRSIPDRYVIVALEAEGRGMTSGELAAYLGERMNRSERGVAFLIGGADGLPKAASERASLVLSLSKMTLPHRLARLVLAEQLYRAMTILRNEPYPR